MPEGRARGYLELGFIFMCCCGLVAVISRATYMVYYHPAHWQSGRLGVPCSVMYSMMYRVRLLLLLALFFFFLLPGSEAVLSLQ